MAKADPSPWPCALPISPGTSGPGAAPDEGSRGLGNALPAFVRAGQDWCGLDTGLGSALDLDPPGAGLGRLRQADGENAVRQFGVDLVGIGVGGHAAAGGGLALSGAGDLARFPTLDPPGAASLVSARA